MADMHMLKRHGAAMPQFTDAQFEKLPPAWQDTRINTEKALIRQHDTAWKTRTGLMDLRMRNPPMAQRDLPTATPAQMRLDASQSQSFGGFSPGDFEAENAYWSRKHGSLVALRVYGLPDGEVA